MSRSAAQLLYGPVLVFKRPTQGVSEEVFCSLPNLRFGLDSVSPDGKYPNKK